MILKTRLGHEKLRQIIPQRPGGEFCIMLRIGEAVEELGMSADTLRYYEKIQLMPKVNRNGAGVRFYSGRDLSRLRFIRRAQKMGFSLEEISYLLGFRDNPQKARPTVRKMAHRKLDEIEHRLAELGALRDELKLLTGLCGASPGGCPILESLDKAANNHDQNHQ